MQTKPKRSKIQELTEQTLNHVKKKGCFKRRNLKGNQRTRHEGQNCKKLIELINLAFKFSFSFKNLVKITILYQVHCYETLI